MTSDERRASAAFGCSNLFWVGDDGQLRTRFKPIGTSFDRGASVLDHAPPRGVHRGRPAFGSVAEMAEERPPRGRRRYEGPHTVGEPALGLKRSARGWDNWMEVLERERNAPPEEEKAMKVRELIERLQAFDPERDVVISFGHLLPDLAIVREISNTDAEGGERVVALIPDPDDVAGVDVMEIVATDDEEGDVE